MRRVGACGKRPTGCGREFIYDVAGNVVAEQESTNGGRSWTWTKGYVYVNGQMLTQYNGVLGVAAAKGVSPRDCWARQLLQDNRG